MSAVAQFDNELRIERIREGKLRKRERGEFAGGLVPFGYRVTTEVKNGKEIEVLEKDPLKQNAIKEMKTLRKEGLSLRKIADAITEKYTKISHQGVKTVLEGKRVTVD